MSDRFDELVDHQALRPEERARLRRVHDLLLEVGPPPEAPAALGGPPEVPGVSGVSEMSGVPGVAEAEVVPLRRPARRRALTLLAAALAATVAGGAGYMLGDRAAGGDPVAQPGTTTVTAVTTAPAATQPRRGPLVSMTGVGEAEGASATVEILPRASSGDYPVRIQVRGLPAGETFELWVIDDGELEQLCGRFATSAGLTDAVVTVPYEMRTRDEWVVVRPGTTEPLLRT